MKKCFECKIEKELKEFYKNKSMKDGHVNKCIDCTKISISKNPRGQSGNINSYDKTEKGVIRVIYKSQKHNSKLRKHNGPNYTKQELSNWLYNNNYKKLYDNWRYNKYDKNLKPSIDRIDTFKNYTIDNIRLMTSRENRLYQFLDRTSGIGTSGLQCKPVIQYKDGIEIARYISFNETRRMMGYSMEKSLKSGKVDRKGYSYKYESTPIHKG